MNVLSLLRLALVFGLLPLLTAEVAAQSFSRADGSTDARPYATALQPAELAARGGGGLSFTQNASLDLVDDTGITCFNEAGGFTDPTQFYRVFDLSAFVGSAFAVSSVDIGVEAVVGGSFPITTTVRLYTLASAPEGGEFSKDDLTLVAEETLTFMDPTDLALVDVPFDGAPTFAPGDLLVVEWDVPGGFAEEEEDRFRIFPGSNSAGDTEPHYVASDACGLSTPTSLAAIGFPDSHWVVVVNGDEVDAVLFPSTGDELAVCKRYQIRYSAPSLDADARVRIALLDGGVEVLVIARAAQNDGRLIWLVPCDFPTGDDYQIRITDSAGTEGFEITGGVFSIVDDLAVIVITAPEAGDEIEAGSTFDITWDSDGVPADTPVTLILRTDEGAVLRVARGTENDGSFTWMVPATLEARDDYRLILRYTLDGEGRVARSDVFSITDGMAAALRGDGGLPAELTLEPAYPNPMRSAGTVRFGLPEAADVTVEVYDVLGRRVAALAEGSREAGWYEAAVEARGLAAGVYLVRLAVGERVLTQRVTVTE